MTTEAAKSEMCAVRRRLEHVVARALITAHLITASIQQAERAVAAAVEAWDAEDDREEGAS